MNNKTLAIIFTALVGAFLLSKMFGSNKSRSFEPNILSLNSDDITEILVQAPGESTSTLSQTDGMWMVSNGDQTYQANQNVASSMLKEISKIEADKVISRSAENAVKYGTDEDSATKITAKSRGKTIGDILVGRFSFNQQTRQPISYVRLAGQDETYLIGSFMASSLNKDFNGLRDKSLISFDPAEVASLSYSNPTGGRTDFVLNLDHNWITSTESVIDSAEIASYLNSISNKSGTQFINEPTVMGGELEEITLTLLNGESLIIRSFKMADDRYKISSDQYADNVFESTESAIYQQIFGRIKELMEQD